MDRITTGKLLVLACVTVIPYVWFQYKHTRNVPTVTEHSTPREAAASETSPRHTSANRTPLEILYHGPTDAAEGPVKVDIVAVHGLGSNVDWSWTWQDKSGRRPPVHWLKDLEMLPAVVPNARIMVYSYESRWHANAPKTRLHLCGKDLIDALHNFRNVPDRPIIFIGHSLGGLVIQYALLLADKDEKFKYLPKNVVGYIALGCPFKGTKMQSIPDIIARFMVLANSHQGIIRDLVYGSDTLRDQLDALCQLKNTLSIPTYCFFELYATDYGKRFGCPGYIKGMVVREESACIDGWPKKSLYTDHLKLNKYSGPEDRSFRNVSAVIKDMYAGAKDVLARRNATTQNCHFIVPFGRNKNFVGRKSILQQLLEKISPSTDQDDCQRTALEGLGGIGKTQIALEAAYQVRDKHPDCSVFWVPAVDATSFENAYRDIGRQLEVKGMEDDKADVKMLVRAALSHESAGSWLMIVDNADDLRLFAGATLSDHLPFSRNGSILFTTRNHEAAVRLDIPQQDIMNVTEMNDNEAMDLLQVGLKPTQICDTESMTHLLGFLANLPLAIKQASAYMAKTGISISKYLQHCQSSDKTMVKLLGQDFEDRNRYKNINNPIATTWLVSFNHISRDYPLAARYLKFICYLAEKDIPVSLLPSGEDELEADEAIGILKGYAFIMERNEPDSFDVHRLVRLAMRNWLQTNGEWQEWATKVFQRLTKKYPFPEHENRAIWMRYLPHGQVILQLRNECADKETDLLFNVAESYSVLGKYNEAEQMYRQTLELKERVLGREHPDTLASMNNLALVLNSQGKYEEAEQMHRQELELSERVLGKDHPSTLRSKANLDACLKAKMDKGL